MHHQPPTVGTIKKQTADKNLFKGTTQTDLLKKTLGFFFTSCHHHHHALRRVKQYLAMDGWRDKIIHEKKTPHLQRRCTIMFPFHNDSKINETFIKFSTRFNSKKVEKSCEKILLVIKFLLLWLRTHSDDTDSKSCDNRLKSQVVGK